MWKAVPTGVGKLQSAVPVTKEGSARDARPSYFFKRNNPALFEMRCVFLLLSVYH